jgi:ribosomal protein S12 methylthiotransferase
VGCFQYENVAGAGSRDFPDQMPEEVKAERYARFMETQQAISESVMQERIGAEIDVIIDEVDEEGAIGRSAWDAPDIDGMVFLNGETELAPGDIVRARLEHAEEYDVWAVLPEAE